ncbi:response regulator [Thalassospira xiamenensis]|nr:response regulator [Pseudidiomarina aestuarii]PTC01588.1 response regulator [Thalassospira xiamenensis]
MLAPVIQQELPEETKKMPPKVLFIDDDNMVRQTITEGLRTSGFTVVSAANGLQGLEKFARAKPDIVITDIIMPDADGLHTIQEIRKKDAKIPIIAVSGGGRTHNMEFLSIAEQLGATATIAKPFRITMLIKEIETLLGK